MTATEIILVLCLALWMGACAYCGYQRRFLGFLAVLLAGLAVNMAWLMQGLSAHPFDVHALVMDAALTIFAVCAFAAGLYAHRVRRVWQETKVDDPGV